MGIQKTEPVVLWQDNHIAVLSKPPYWVCSTQRDNTAHNRMFLTTLQYEDSDELVASGKVEHLVQYIALKFKHNKSFQLAEKPEYEFGCAHRLDVDTSGALLIGKTVKGITHLGMLFRSSHVYKEYVCLVHGRVKKDHGVINAPIAYAEFSNESYIDNSGLHATSIYTVMGRYRFAAFGKKRRMFTLCRVVIITGRTHQIRVHMKHLGHPLVSDPKYCRQMEPMDRMWCSRLFLHAWRLGFWDCDNNWVSVHAPVPPDLMAALQELEEVQLDENPEAPSLRVLYHQPGIKMYQEGEPAAKSKLSPIQPASKKASTKGWPIWDTAMPENPFSIGAQKLLREDEDSGDKATFITLKNGIQLKVPDFKAPEPPSSEQWQKKWELNTSQNDGSSVSTDRARIRVTTTARGREVTVDLRDMRLGDDDVWRELTESLCRRLRKKLHELEPDAEWYYANFDLSNNYIGPKGAAALANFLKISRQSGTPIHARNLLLYKNKLGDEGMKQLAGLLISLPQPAHEIHLSHNAITGLGAAILVLAFGSIHPSHTYPIYMTSKGRYAPCWVRLERNQVEAPGTLMKAMQKSGHVRVIETSKADQQWGPLRSPAVCAAEEKTPHAILHLFSQQNTTRERPKHELAKVVSDAMNALLSLIGEQEREPSVSVVRPSAKVSTAAAVAEEPATAPRPRPPPGLDAEELDPKQEAADIGAAAEYSMQAADVGTAVADSIEAVDVEAAATSAGNSMRMPPPPKMAPPPPPKAPPPPPPGNAGSSNIIMSEFENPHLAVLRPPPPPPKAGPLKEEAKAPPGAPPVPKQHQKPEKFAGVSQGESQNATGVRQTLDQNLSQWLEGPADEEEDANAVDPSTDNESEYVFAFEPPVRGEPREASTPTASDAGSALSQRGKAGGKPGNYVAVSMIELNALEEEIRSFVRHFLLRLKTSQATLSDLGNKKEIVQLLQKMGKRRPKMTQILGNRPEIFIITTNRLKEPVVTLSWQAKTDTLKELEQREEAATEAGDDESSEEEAEQNYEESLGMLVDMGFDPHNAMKALRANHGDVFEAMDMLAVMRVPDIEEGKKAIPEPIKGGKQAKAGAKSNPKADKKAKQRQKEQRRRDERKVQQMERRQRNRQQNVEEDESDEDELARVLAMSRQEQEQRKTQEQLEEEALAAALEASRQDSSGFKSPGAPAPAKSKCFADDEEEDSDEDDLAKAIRESQKQEEPGNDDDDDVDEEDEEELLSRALRESQQHFSFEEDERKRLERQEEQELEIALRESQTVYEMFHATGDDDFTRTLQQSLWEAKLTMDDEGGAISDSKWKAIMSAYDEVDDDEEEEDEEEEEEKDKNKGRSVSSGSGQPAAVSSPPARSSGSGGGSSAAASSSHAAADSAAASSAGPGPRNFDLQGWFRQRADELKVDFEKDVLWFVLNELEDEQLHDREAVKMWLGLSPDDKVPAALSSLIGEFAQHKRGMK